MKKHRVIKIGCILVTLISIFAVASLIISNVCIQLTEYSILVESPNKLTIALITDTHNKTFGKGNERLLKKVSAQAPDAIFIAGDLVDMYSPEYAPAEELVKSLCAIAPVYISLGNHDTYFISNFDIDLYEIFTLAGATVLEHEYEDIVINDVPVRIGGIYGYCLSLEVSGAVDEENEFLYDFADTDRLKLLLCHMPAAFLEWGSLDAWDIDVIFCGHAHGGQVRLPFIGGVYAPDQGWFPGKLSGLYCGKQGNVLVLSRGLGGTTPVPRFNNPSELVIVELEPTQK